jgi:acetoin utilization protein AcuB
LFVRDVMLKSPVTVDIDNSVAQVLKVMEKEKIRALPVVSGHKLVGVVTEKQILKVAPSSFSSLDAFETRYFFEQMKVAEVMHRFPLTLTPDTTIEEAAVYLREHRLGSVPVVDGERLAGIITITNIFDGMVETREYDLKGTILIMEAHARQNLLADIYNMLDVSRVQVKETIIHVKEDKKAKIKLRLTTNIGRQVVDALESLGLKVTFKKQ